MSRHAIDLTGQVFTRLTVVRRVPAPSGRPRWLCLCQCGAEHYAFTDSLRSGLVRSCGCLHREVASANASKRGKEAAARRARERAMYGDGDDKPSGYCCRPTRYLRPKRDAVLALADVFGLRAQREAA
jgi:hypothetical protein